MFRIIHGLILVAVITLILAWIGSMTHLDWVWPKLRLLLFGWWLLSVLYSLMYEGETYAHFSIGSSFVPFFGPIALLSYLGEKVVNGQEWTWQWNLPSLLGPLKGFIA